MLYVCVHVDCGTICIDMNMDCCTVCRYVFGLWYCIYVGMYVDCGTVLSQVLIHCLQYSLSVIALSKSSLFQQSNLLFCIPDPFITSFLKMGIWESKYAYILGNRAELISLHKTNEITIIT